MLRVSAQNVFGKPEFWIRYNHDKYKPFGFDVRRRGVRCCFKKKRLACLARVIQSVKDGNLPFTVEEGKVYVIYLYYDGWNDDGSGEVNWKIIVDDETEIDAVEAEVAERAQPPAPVAEAEAQAETEASTNEVVDAESEAKAEGEGETEGEGGSSKKRQRTQTRIHQFFFPSMKK